MEADTGAAQNGIPDLDLILGGGLEPERGPSVPDGQSPELTPSTSLPPSEAVADGDLFTARGGRTDAI